MKKEKPSVSKLDATNDFIAYFAEFLKRQVIGDRELIGLIQELQKGQLINPIPRESAPTSQLLRLGFKTLQGYIDQNNRINQQKLLYWAQKKLKEREDKRVCRKEASVKTGDPYRKIEFNRIESGSFEMGEGKDKVKVTISNPFQMMSTLVTQKHWFMIMDENPSHFVNGEHTLANPRNGKPIKMLPDNPVESVNSYSICAFIEKLNESSKSGAPILEQLISSHQKGDQYRLPTEAEWEYVVRDRGRANGTWHFGDNEADLKDYAWYRDNSDKITHPVANRSPLTVDRIVNGKKFFDLYGNVWELVQDWYGPLQGGADPKGSNQGTHRVSRGGSWYSYAQSLRSTCRGRVKPCCCGFDLGFRLVRMPKAIPS